MSSEPSDASPRLSGTERVFNAPRLYRAKMSAVHLATWPLKAALLRNLVPPDDVLLQRISDGMRVFEIGCGDGNLFRLLQTHRRAVQYTGSDYNPHMVEHCRQQYPEAKWEEYRGGAYAHPDYAFDLCVIRGVLHHIASRDDIVLTVREAARIARRAIVFEPLQSENPALASVKSIYWHVTDGGSHYMRLDALRQVWRDAGAQVEWESFTRPLRHSYACILSRMGSAQA